MEKNHILFVEDDAQYRSFVSEVLRKKGYLVDSVESPIEGIDIFEKDKYALVISDLKLEAVDGIKFLKFIKKVDPDIRTMILTGSPSEETEKLALDLQIDQYILKELRVDVLLNYIEYLVLFTEKPVSTQRKKLISINEDIILDLDAHEVYKNNVEISLTAKQYQLLSFFLQNQGIAVSREQIIDVLWEKEIENIDPRIVDGHVKDLRKKLNIHSIISIRGFGYKWSE